MLNIDIIENDLTKYKEVIVQHSCTQARSSRRQWRRQSPGGGVMWFLQNLCAVQPEILVIESSSNQEYLHHNDQIRSDGKYKNESKNTKKK